MILAALLATTLAVNKVDTVELEQRELSAQEWATLTRRDGCALAPVSVLRVEKVSFKQGFNPITRTELAACLSVYRSLFEPAKAAWGALPRRQRPMVYPDNPALFIARLEELQQPNAFSGFQFWRELNIAIARADALIAQKKELDNG